MTRFSWKSPTALALGVVLVTTGFLFSCSRDATGPAPESTTAAMQGSTDFPGGAVAPEGVVITFGERESAVDTAGDFSIQGNRGAPGVAIAMSEGSAPLLMAIVPDPQDGTHIGLDVSSTAAALAFLSPFVCVNDAAGASEVLAILEGLPETGDLRVALEAKLAIDPQALGAEDAEIDSLLTRVVNAYLGSYPEVVERAYPGAIGGLQSSNPSAPEPHVAAADPSFIIDPSSVVSGHQVTHLSGDTFRLTNARGRWAYCLTPQADFYSFPNGSLLDVLRNRMWAPSRRDFDLDFGELPTDSATVYVYGLGFVDERDNIYDDLSSSEQDYVLLAGGATVLFEFVPQLISVLTNTSKTFLSAEIANRNVKLVLDFLKYGRIGDRTREYIRNSDYFGLVWYLSREGVSAVAFNNDFRAAYLESINLRLTDQAFARLACWAILPLRVVMITDSATSALKTAYGFVSTRFRTTFKIYRETPEEIAVGAIQVSVHDSESGLPIEGATVEVLGDDDNPLHPAHQAVTSSSGGYYFSNIQIGAKTLRVGKAGYASTVVGVEVVEDQTVAVDPIALTRACGSVTGRILDRILQRSGAADPRFVKRLTLSVREIGGEQRSYPYTIDDGDYHIDLGAGTWRFVANHDDYAPDSIQVTVAADQTVAAPRDLLMEPKGMMEGHVYLDMNDDGAYEIEEDFTAAVAGARRFLPDWSCPGGTPRELIEVRGVSATGEDIVDVLIDPARLTSAGDHQLGGIIVAGCSGYDPKAGASYYTERRTCHNPEYGYDSAMVFADQGMPDYAACDCGITDYGSLTLDEYGPALTDAIDGLLVAHLAGSRRCDCYCCEDVDHDGAQDDWVVECARARVDVHLRVLVGSLTDSR